MKVKQNFTDENINSLMKLVDYHLMKDGYPGFLRTFAKNAHLLAVLFSFMLVSRVGIVWKEYRKTGVISVMDLILLVMLVICIVIYGWQDRFVEARLKKSLIKHVQTPFLVEFRESKLVYDGEEILYREIYAVVYYADLLFMYIKHGKRIVFRVLLQNGQVSENIGNIISANDAISVYHEVVPFSIIKYKYMAKDYTL